MPAPRRTIKRIVVPVKDPGGGPIRAAIEAEGAALALFSDAERNAIVRDGMWQGGEYWRLNFLWQRFTDYARRLGYKVSDKYERTKKKVAGVILPLVGIYSHGTAMPLRERAISGAHTIARATGSKAVAEVRIPHPRYANQQEMVRTTLRRVPAWEIQAVANVVGKAVTGTLDEAEIYGNPSKGEARLTRVQKKTMERSVAHRQAPRSTRATLGRVA